MNDFFSLKSSKLAIGTKVFCILSDERAFQSKSPAMFSKVMERVGVKGVYVPFMVKPEKLGEAIHSLRILNIAGANITVPYKEAVIPFMDTLSESAKIMGAINTIARDGDKFKGYNTNAIGFMDTLESVGFDPTGKSALVFGSGGAARAVVFILNWLRANSIRIAARNTTKAKIIAKDLGGEAVTIDSLMANPFPADIIVNTTSVSSHHEAPVFAEMILKMTAPNCELIIDLNYGRGENFWEDFARIKKIRFMDGLTTLAHQAMRTFALWTGIKVEPKEFLKALDE
ncbi:MAG: shikimate dehydrogenase [Desulfobacteraceae bacterium]|nr:shikimate dehydrogenase [Desulfobacteraceae bacterium]MBU4001914.1 shikimate dehydrogenase [Pseudomonadota bacterium]MBU4052898.1 shikimate dehydrogenase [Pseudomonadota bacterium]